VSVVGDRLSLSAVLRFDKQVRRSLMPTVTVKLSEPEFSQLEAMATASKRTKSDVLREALSASAQGTSTSLLDAMRAYIGKLSGPGDLSTNKARMKGYGTACIR
jgi:hypothetical protein